MALTDEERRALEHRRQARRRAAYRAAREAQLAGSAAARRQLDADWAPIADRDRQEADQ